MLRGLKSLFELLFTDYSTKQNNQLGLRIHALPFPLFIITPSRFIFLFFPLEGHAVLKLFNSPTGSTKLLAADEKFLFRFIVRARTWEIGQREGSVLCLSAATRRDACLVARKAFFPVGAGKRAGATKFSFFERNAASTPARHADTKLSVV